MAIHLEKHNSAFIKITGDLNDKLLISAHFKKPVKDYFFTPLYRSGRWDGHLKFFNSSTGLIFYGLFNELFEYIEKTNIQFTVSEELLAELTPADNIEDSLLQKIHSTIKIPNLELRDYQFRGAKKILEMKRGLLEHGTGAGKTITIYLIINYLLQKGLKKFIFVVPTTSLLQQAYNDFKEYGFPVETMVGKYFGDEKDDSKPITIGTWQSLSKNAKLLKATQVVLVDEVHGARSTEVKKLVEQCINADYRIGVTGSLPDWETDRFTIMGCLGPIIDTISSNELIHKEKVLTPVKVKVLNLHYPKEVTKGIKDYETERGIIEDSEMRKNLVKSILSSHCAGQNTMVIFDKKEALGRVYYDYIRPHIPDATFYWISGEIKSEEREKIRGLTNSGSNVILFGTLGCISTGINIPNLDNIVFLYIGKSLIRIKQSIGRGLRKHEGKEVATIYDISDNLKYSKNHLIERIKIYAREGIPCEVYEVGKQ